MTTRSSASAIRVAAVTASRRTALALGMAVLATGGCSLLRSPTTPPTTFYVLSASPPASEVAAGRTLTLGLGPISLPPYLNRPEMVRRVAANQLTFDEFNRWSEPLKANVVRVLGADLDSLLGGARLIPFPWYSTTKMDYAVEVNILRFEPQPDGQVFVDAHWAIDDRTGTQFLNRDAHYAQSADSPAQTAAALSTMLGELARDIASALRTTDAVRSK